MMLTHTHVFTHSLALPLSNASVLLGACGEYLFMKKSDLLGMRMSV